MTTESSLYGQIKHNFGSPFVKLYKVALAFYGFKVQKFLLLWAMADEERAVVITSLKKIFSYANFQFSKQET